MALSAKSAAENYNIENPNILTVSLQTLWEEQYIDTIEDPGKKTQNCTGKVTIEKVESVEDKKLDMNKYTVNICCRKYNYTYIFPEGTKTEDDSCKS